MMGRMMGRAHEAGASVGGIRSGRARRKVQDTGAGQFGLGLGGRQRAQALGRGCGGDRGVAGAA
ncbi:hypothetical protein BX265_8317 [Streptomyces sp. TLI_235]|nr:hypothetical protein BX265_8317 [Streptomyces sp. TLI_235]